MKKTIFLAILAIFLSGCVETVVVGTVAGSVVAVREKSLKDTSSDTIIAAKIDKNLLFSGMKGWRNSVEVMVNEGRVLLVGVVRDLDKGKKMTEMVWKVKGVRELIDEVEVDAQGLRVRDFGGGFYDAYLTAKIKSKLFLDKEVTSSDFKIKTQNRVVYILGVAKDSNELRGVLRAIAKTKGVKRVVNHAIFINDSRRS